MNDKRYVFPDSKPRNPLCILGCLKKDPKASRFFAGNKDKEKNAQSLAKQILKTVCKIKDNKYFSNHSIYLQSQMKYFLPPPI